MTPWCQFIPGTIVLIIAALVAVYRRKTPIMSLADSVAAVQASASALSTQVAATVAFVNANGDSAASAALDAVKSQLDGLTSQLASVTPAAPPIPPAAAGSASNSSATLAPKTA